MQQEQDQTAVISEFLSRVCSWINGIIPLCPSLVDGPSNIKYDILCVLIICIYQYISLCKSMLFIIIRFVRRICLRSDVSKKKTIVSNYHLFSFAWPTKRLGSAIGRIRGEIDCCKMVLLSNKIYEKKEKNTATTYVSRTSWKLLSCFANGSARDTTVFLRNICCIRKQT